MKKNVAVFFQVNHARCLVSKIKKVHFLPQRFKSTLKTLDLSVYKY